MSWGLEAKREFVLSNKNTPKDIGPGKYDVSVHIGNTKGMKAPFNIRAHTPPDPRAHVPGPGAYDTDLSGDDTHVYSSVFNSRTSRREARAPATPSPTDYAGLTDWLPEPAPVIQRRAKDPVYRPPSGYIGQREVVGYAQTGAGQWLPIERPDPGEAAIGPGKYDPVIPSRGIPATDLGRDARRDIYGPGVDVPGPGAYSPHVSDKRLAIAIPKRHEEKPSSSVRKIYGGPRVWTSLAAESNAVFKFHGDRQIFSEVADQPPVGTYETVSTRKLPPGDGRGFSVRAKRPPLDVPKDTPGPGAYEVKNKWVKRGRHPTRRATDKEIVNEDPGPGAYETEIKHRVVKRPNSVFMSRSARKTNPETDPPGPGKYSPKVMDDCGRVQPKIKRGRYKRVGDWLAMSLNDNPSPDRYQKLPDAGTRGRTIPKSPRFEPEKKGWVPGPGTYKIKHGTLMKPSRNSSIPQIPDDDD